MRYRTSSYPFNNKHGSMGPGYGEQSSWITALGLLVALVAIMGTQFLDWEWGSGQLVPTLIGVAVAGIAVLLVIRRVR
jgi:FtsH-binding integral membrane protein